jgi:hypothetical protein
VYVEDAPERDASASRSGTDCPSLASRQHQSRIVFDHTASFAALSRTPTLSAACPKDRQR